MTALIYPTRTISGFRLATAFAVALIITAAAGCGPSAELPVGPLPENVGYLRSSSSNESSNLSKLIIFDADTFEIYRTVSLPESNRYTTNRLAKDDYGRIWLSYYPYRSKVIFKSDNVPVHVFSPDGELLHKVTGCGTPVNTVFAHDRAFLLCPGNQVAVIDLATMTTVKIIDEIDLPVEPIRQPYPSTLALVDGVILVFGDGYPPETYNSITHTSDGVAMVAAIGPITLEVVGYNTSLQPGSRIEDALEVGGQAWMLNKWSHIEERPRRTDVYVLDPHTMEIVDSFNLPRPYPNWGHIAADGTIYIFHTYNLRPGFSRVDPETREATFTAAEGVAELGFDWNQAIDVYRGRPCVTQIRTGLWCQNADGTMTLEIEQLGAHGILFVPAGD